MTDTVDPKADAAALDRELILAALDVIAKAYDTGTATTAHYDTLHTIARGVDDSYAATAQKQRETEADDHAPAPTSAYTDPHINTADRLLSSPVSPEGHPMTARTAAPAWTPLYTQPGDLVPVLDGSGDGTVSEPFAWNYKVDGTTYTDHITAYEVVARLWAIAAEKGNRGSLREQAADLADDFTQRLEPLPGGHRDDRLLCQVPVFYTGGVRIVPHWPKSLTNHGWTCLNCDTTFSDNGYGATMAALFVHAHTCGHHRAGLPHGAQVRESVWEQIGTDTGWSAALDAAQFTAAETQAALEQAEADHQRELEQLRAQHQDELTSARAEERDKAKTTAEQLVYAQRDLDAVAGYLDNGRPQGNRDRALPWRLHQARRRAQLRTALIAAPAALILGAAAAAVLLGSL